MKPSRGYEELSGSLLETPFEVQWSSKGRLKGTKNRNTSLKMFLKITVINLNDMHFNDDSPTSQKSLIFQVIKRYEKYEVVAVEVAARGSRCMAIAAPAAPLGLFQFYNHQSLHNDANWTFFVQPTPSVHNYIFCCKA